MLTANEPLPSARKRFKNTVTPVLDPGRQVTQRRSDRDPGSRETEIRDHGEVSTINRQGHLERAASSPSDGV